MDTWVRDFAAAHAWLTYVPVVSNALPEDGWSGRSGFVHQAVLDDLPDLSAYQVYACGAPIVVDSARKDFCYLAGLSEDNFFADSFTSEADKAHA
jgi:CDP-4-dehydro-6-deoxyglucose reductase